MGGSPLGYIGCLISSIFFGSNYLPVKQYDASDGFYFQFFQAVGIWIIGLIVNLIQNTPKFQPLAMIGGVLWCTGNIMTVKIISILGLGQGLIIWGSVNLLTGWLSGFLGIIIKSEYNSINYIWLNLLGVFFAIVSLIISSLIQPSNDQEYQEQDQQIESFVSVDDEQIKISPKKQKLLGFMMAAIAGFCYGFSFSPSIYIIQNYKDVSQIYLDYVFSHFCGILIMSICVFIAYCMYKKNIPVINPQISLPGIISGLLWAIAMSAWFYSNGELGQTISFPITAIGPGFVGSLWSVFYFREIQGRRNFILLGIYFTLGITGCICIACSKL